MTTGYTGQEWDEYLDLIRVIVRARTGRRVARRPGSRARCPMCGRLGWVLDCNDINRPGPRMVEFMPCFYPTCEYSGQPIQSLAFKCALPFNRASHHPKGQGIMSVTR